MTNFQDTIDALLSKAREERLSNSSQLSLGELKLKLQLVNDKSKEIVFDFGKRPAGASSWRGSYRELGLKYSDNGGGRASWNNGIVSSQSDDGQYKGYESDTFILTEKPTTQKFLDMLEALTNKEMVGYKGGDFKMHKNVSVYFGNYSESSVDNYKGEEWATVVPVDITETEELVIINTEKQEY